MVPDERGGPSHDVKYVHRENFSHLIGPVGFDAAGLLERVLDEHVNPKLKSGGYSLEQFIADRKGSFVPTLRVRGFQWLIILADGKAYLDEERDLLENREKGGEQPLVQVQYDLDGIKHAFVTPLPCLMRGVPSLAGLYQCYMHVVGDHPSAPKSEIGLQAYAQQLYAMAYIGLTKQGWSKRWSQHLRAARTGSPYLFHKHLRARLATPGTKISHNVMAVGMSYDEAMNLEEETVSSRTLRPKGLNMIPGGYAGLQYMHMLGALNRDRHRSEIENRAELMTSFMRDNTALQALWADPSWAANVICGHSGRLTLEQVRAVRELASRGHQAEQIFELIDARNLAQVRRLLRGDTYSRVA
jgi:hypothetical protein